MSRPLLLFFFIFLFSSYSFAQDDPFEVAEKCGYATRNFSRRSEPPALNVTFQQLFFDINPANGFMIAHSRVIFSPYENAQWVAFDLHSALSVDSVMRGTESIAFTRLGNQVLINYTPSLMQGSSDTLEIHYSGQPSFQDLYYSRTAHASGNIVATRSQPYGCMYWWPCQNTLSDKIDSLEVTILCDSIYTGVSNGVLIEKNLVDGSRNSFKWKHNYPIAPYLVAISVSPYALVTDYAKVNGGQDSIKIENYVYPFYKPTAEILTKQTIPMMTLFDSLFGPYPFMNEQYGHAQFHHGGGMEHQTMSFMGSFSFDLIAHELAHQWFGDKVTCRVWEELWLNEGFATYGNLLCYQFLRGDSLWLNRLESTIDEVVSQPGGSVFVRDTSGFPTLFDQRLVYKKGAMVLHMLRFVCGDEDFFQGLRNYLEDTALAYGFARQSDLKWHLEQVTGKDLTIFFEQWIMNEGHPSFAINYSQSPDGNLKLRINQQTSHPSVSFFETPVPLRLLGKNGAIQDISILPSSANYETSTQVSFEIENILFDPQKWLLARGLVIKDGATDRPSLLIYPNPNNGMLRVISYNADMESYRILSAEGKEVVSVELADSIKRGEGLVTNITGLSNGFYIFEVTTTNGIQTGRFILNR